MLLTIEKSGEHDYECPKQWLVDTDPNICQRLFQLLLRQKLCSNPFTNKPLYASFEIF